MAEEQKEKSFLRKHWSNILFVVVLALIVYPKTRMPIISTVQRIIAFSPSTSGTDEQLNDYRWNLADLDGNPLSFSEAENEVVFVNFWATWCPPCVAEMPYMQDLYEEYGDKMKFYFVTDEDPTKIRKFMDKHDYDLPIQIATSAPPEILEAKALPTTYVIGKNGDIHIKKKGSAKWNSKKVYHLLDDLLAE